MRHIFNAVSMWSALLALAGCELSGQNCTLEARSSLGIRVTDQTGAPVTDATVTASVDDEAPLGCAASGSLGDYTCDFFEREGVFTVRAARAGETASATATVGRTADGCHVDTEALALTVFVDAHAPCCCQFLVEGDVLEEDLDDTVAACRARVPTGQCVAATDRIAPHPCCPEVEAGGRCP